MVSSRPNSIRSAKALSRLTFPNAQEFGRRFDILVSLPAMDAIVT